VQRKKKKITITFVPPPPRARLNVHRCARYTRPAGGIFIVREDKARTRITFTAEKDLDPPPIPPSRLHAGLPMLSFGHKSYYVHPCYVLTLRGVYALLALSRGNATICVLAPTRLRTAETLSPDAFFLHSFHMFILFYFFFSLLFSFRRVVIALGGDTIVLVVRKSRGYKCFVLHYFPTHIRTPPPRIFSLASFPVRPVQFITRRRRYVVN
jgi:hypothetical protein